MSAEKTSRVEPGTGERAQLCLCPAMQLEQPLSPPGTSSATRWAPSSILKAWSVRVLLPGESDERSALVFATEDILPVPHSARGRFWL